MKNTEKHIKIAVVDDSDFYNRIITHQLKNYVKSLEIEFGFKFDISSYTGSDDFERELKEDLDFVFTDYFLGNNKTAQNIIELTQKKCDACTVIVISQIRNSETSINSLQTGATKFILKDKNALEKACFFLSDFLTNPARA